MTFGLQYFAVSHSLRLPEVKCHLKHQEIQDLNYRCPSTACRAVLTCQRGKGIRGLLWKSIFFIFYLFLRKKRSITHWLNYYLKQVWMNHVLPQSKSWHEEFWSYWTSILPVLITSVISELYQILKQEISCTVKHSKVARHPLGIYFINVHITGSSGCIISKANSKLMNLRSVREIKLPVLLFTLIFIWWETEFW